MGAGGTGAAELGQNHVGSALLSVREELRECRPAGQCGVAGRRPVWCCGFINHTIDKSNTD